MLRLEHIIKNYEMKGAEVKALKDISVCFRKSEFVSILGPSGCGKTTLLNILGGLDHYSSGNLIIDGKSTMDFKDRDWDIYRNHRIGFIFQSYNLIPQENILENVELALTIAGIGKEERERRAKEALDRVGLKDLYKKKPNQLSGGQCQRVAIARALVNEPEILLADEPTGALDSKTSVQIMDLIKEISKERLVIMVTHNPELAEEYSSRIISLLDGQIVNDTNPYSEAEEQKEREGIEHKESEKEKAKMSWFTAFKLSAKNLWVKAKRTAMIIVAASIGIIGVSAVLSVSGGVTGYIDSMQDEMLSGNPVAVQREGYDISKLMDSANFQTKSDAVKGGIKDGYVDVDFMIESLINSANQMGNMMISNDITEDYLNYVKAMPQDYYQDISYHYGINVSNNIYTKDDIVGQPEDTFYSLSSILNIASGIVNRTDYGSYSSVISSMGSSFYQSLSNEDYLLSQYDIVEGKIAEKEDEIMIVLNGNEMITDFTLTLLGYYSQDTFMNLIYKYTENEKYDDQKFQKDKQIALTDLMSKEFYYYPNDTILTANTGSSSKTRPFLYSYQRDTAWSDGLKLNVVGVLTPKQNRQYTSLQPGFYYTPKFTERFLKDNYDSKISQFIRDYNEQNPQAGGYPSGSYERTLLGIKQTVYYGIYYTYPLEYEGTRYETNYAYLGSSNSMAGLLSMMMGSSSNMVSTSLTSNAVGGENLPTGISFYPKSFETKYLVTDYLDEWNSDKNLTVNGKELKKEDRNEITYSDNLQVVITMINTIIQIVTIALICFTALSLVVSTVMIGIITYVSVMERIKEIGIIRALGGRKKDVSHLFNAETFLIGSFSGLFGILVTYLLQAILNLVIHSLYPVITTIANLSLVSAVIIILVSILLTTIAGLIPSRSAAKKDPVVALRTE